MSDKYTVYLVQAYEALLPDGNLTNSIIFELIADDVDDAISQAKNMIKGTSQDKKHFRLARVIQKYKE